MAIDGSTQAHWPIGILGGTFDPVHFGHLRIALELQQALDLQQVKLMPCQSPPHRSGVVATATQRLAMLKLAVNNEPNLRVDDYEYQQSGPSYTVNTLEYLRKKVGQVPLCLIMGTDSFNTLLDWHQWQRIFDLTHLVIAQRPGTPTQPSTSKLWPLVQQRFVSDPAVLMHQPQGYILPWPVTQLAISATKIRQLLLSGQRVRYLLPDRVIDYINSQRIYHDG